MFTGIIEGIGTITKVDRRKDDLTLSVDVGKHIEKPVIGESIALNGVCLTVVKIEKSYLAFDVSMETINRTTFAGVSVGDKVNLERAMRLGDRVGGHLVSGHVDSVAPIIKIAPAGEGYDIEVGIDPAGMRYIIEKGSIALSGISLTVATKKTASIAVAIIPHTFKETTLSLLKPGSALNVEYDMIAKYVENFVKPENGGIGKDFLTQHGFM